MESVSPKNSVTSLPAAPPQSTDAATANVATKASLPKLCETRCWSRDVKRAESSQDTKIAFHVLTYTYSRSERVFRRLILLLGSFLLVPLLFSKFRNLGASTKSVALISKQAVAESISRCVKQIVGEPRLIAGYKAYIQCSKAEINQFWKDLDSCTTGSGDARQIKNNIIIAQYMIKVAESLKSEAEYASIIRAVTRNLQDEG